MLIKYMLYKKKKGFTLTEILVVIVLIILVALALRSMVRDKKNGKSLQCGGDCSKCGGHCH